MSPFITHKEKFVMESRGTEVGSVLGAARCERPTPPEGYPLTSRRHTSDTAAPPRAPARQGSILLVDDDEPLARSLSRVLKMAGYDVAVAHNGAVAVDRRSCDRAFDVILSDIHMPGHVRRRSPEHRASLRPGRAGHSHDGDPTLETAMEAVSLGACSTCGKPSPNEVRSSRRSSARRGSTAWRR